MKNVATAAFFLTFAFLFAAHAQTEVPRRYLGAPPFYHPEECGQVSNPPRIFFGPGAVTSEGFDAGSINKTVSEWQQSGGYVLLKGHVDRREEALLPSGLDDIRIQFVRGELIKLGVDPKVFWTKAMGAAEPLILAESDRLNRSVEVIMPSSGKMCREERFAERTTWFKENCFEGDRGPELKIACASTFYSIERSR